MKKRGQRYVHVGPGWLSLTVRCKSLGIGNRLQDRRGSVVATSARFLTSKQRAKGQCAKESPVAGRPADEWFASF